MNISEMSVYRELVTMSPKKSANSEMIPAILLKGIALGLSCPLSLILRTSSTRCCKVLRLHLRGTTSTSLPVLRPNAAREPPVKGGLCLDLRGTLFNFNDATPTTVAAPRRPCRQPLSDDHENSGRRARRASATSLAASSSLPPAARVA